MSGCNTESVTKKPKLRQFDHRPFKRRHIALKLLYLGWEYDGLATQEHSQNTIEYHLIDALTKTCMIKSREDCNFQRCGRTDKGVSSYGQVLSLDVRSVLTDESSNIGLFTPADYQLREQIKVSDQEINYVGILNRVLPADIRAIAWAPVRRQFSSRFDCKRRSYYYIFPRGNLSIDSMSQALQYLVGNHDFRNLCTMDLRGGVTNYVRTIFSARIECEHNDPGKIKADSMFRMIIVGQGFLYHQIRCIMSIALLIGMKLESPKLMRDLLDLEKTPGKPHYTMASPLPLVLFDCSYDDSNLPRGWIYDKGAVEELISAMKKLWFQYSLKASIVGFMLNDINQTLEEQLDNEARSRLSNWQSFGLKGDNFRIDKYVPIELRNKSETLESRLERMQKDRKDEDQKFPVA